MGDYEPDVCDCVDPDDPDTWVYSWCRAGWVRAYIGPAEPLPDEVPDEVFARLVGYIEDGDTDDIRTYRGRAAALAALEKAIREGE